MGKLIAILGGIIAIVLGIWGVFVWWGDFLLVLRGTVPAFLILAGLIALIAGIGEVKDSIARKKEEKEEEKEQQETSKQETSQEKSESSEE